MHSYRDQITRSWKPLTKDGAKMINITAGDLYDKSNYQDAQRYPEWTSPSARTRKRRYRR